MDRNSPLNDNENNDIEKVVGEQQEETTEEQQDESQVEQQEQEEETTEEQQDESPVEQQEQEEETTEEQQDESPVEQQYESPVEQQEEIVTIISVGSHDNLVENIQEKLSEIASLDEEEIGIITIPEEEEVNQSLKAEHLNIIHLGLSVLNRRYGESINFDNNLLIQITKESIEYIETFNRFTGNEKHIICKEIIKIFLTNRGIEWKKIDKVINNAISFVVSISKNGVQALKLDKKVVGDVQDIFNQLYPLILKDMEKKYPTTDDIVNHLFDICLVTMGYMENYKQITQKQKIILIKSILMKVIELLPTIYKEITNDEIKFLEENIDTTLLMVELGLDAQDGGVNINAEQVEKISNCLFKCILSCFKKFKN